MMLMLMSIINSIFVYLLDFLDYKNREKKIFFQFVTVNCFQLNVEEKSRNKVWRGKVNLLSLDIKFSMKSTFC